MAKRNFPASVIATVQKQIADFGQAGATGIERIPDLASPIPAAVGLVPGEATPPPLTFIEPGYVIAMYGQERAGTPYKHANTELRLTLNGQWDVIRQGNAGPAFFPFLGLFGPNVNWFSLLRYVKRNDVWQASYRNFDTAATAMPTVGFAFLSDAEIDRMASELG